MSEAIAAVKEYWWLVIAMVVGFNSIMMALHGMLEGIKHKTESKLDDDVDSVVVKIISVLQWLIDVSVGNKAHK